MNRTFATLIGSLAATLTVSTAALAQGTPPAAPPSPAPVQPTTPPAGTKPKAPAEQPADQSKAAQQEKPAVSNDASLVYVRLSTSKGDVFLELNQAKAPVSVKNFLQYVDKKYYDGTIFHRVIDKFMIQGGGFDASMKEKPGLDKPIKNEWTNGLKNNKGTVAMARTAAVDSATSQFYINVVDNPFLDQPRDGAAYAVFGRVVGAMDTLDKIKSAKTVTKGVHSDVPAETIEIKSVTRCTAEDASKGGK